MMSVQHSTLPTNAESLEIASLVRGRNIEPAGRECQSAREKQQRATVLSRLNCTEDGDKLLHTCLLLFELLHLKVPPLYNS